MRIVPSLVWELEGKTREALDARLMPLLTAIATTHSLAAAVVECGVSYRAAWGLLREYEVKLGAALVTLQRGRGASLTDDGQRLLDAHRVALRRLAGTLPALAAEIGRPARAPNVAAPATLRVAASHDLALAALAEALPTSAGVDLELSFMGSLHAIDAFVAGRADMAGFHVPLSSAARADAKAFFARLDGRRDRLIRFVDREQGLIVPPGNPEHLRSFRDIATRGVRFLNRQRGSGTRLIVDAMLRDAHLAASDINGYHTEEFTHAAVAATVASGGAEVGFGLRAAAAEYRLGFVPLLRERYFLAVRSKELESPGVSRFLTALRSPACTRTLRAFVGYDISGAGAVTRPEGFARAARGATIDRKVNA